MTASDGDIKIIIIFLYTHSLFTVTLLDVACNKLLLLSQHLVGLEALLSCS